MKEICWYIQASDGIKRWENRPAQGCRPFGVGNKRASLSTCRSLVHTALACRWKVVGPKKHKVFPKEHEGMKGEAAGTCLLGGETLLFVSGRTDFGFPLKSPTSKLMINVEAKKDKWRRLREPIKFRWKSGYNSKAILRRWRTRPGPLLVITRQSTIRKWSVKLNASSRKWSGLDLVHILISLLSLVTRLLSSFLWVFRESDRATTMRGRKIIRIVDSIRTSIVTSLKNIEPHDDGQALHYVVQTPSILLDCFSPRKKLTFHPLAIGPSNKSTQWLGNARAF